MFKQQTTLSPSLVPFAGQDLFCQDAAGAGGSGLPPSNGCYAKRGLFILKRNSESNCGKGTSSVVVCERAWSYGQVLTPCAAIRRFIKKLETESKLMPPASAIGPSSLSLQLGCYEQKNCEVTSATILLKSRAPVCALRSRYS